MKNKMEKMRKKLNELYIREGLTDRVIKLSEQIDILVIKKQKELIGGIKC